MKDPMETLDELAAIRDRFAGAPEDSTWAFEEMAWNIGASMARHGWSNVTPVRHRYPWWPSCIKELGAERAMDLVDKGYEEWKENSE